MYFEGKAQSQTYNSKYHPHERPSSEEEYEYTYDISTTCDDLINSRAHEVFADVKFDTFTHVTLQGKEDTGAVATCMPL